MIEKLDSIIIRQQVIVKSQVDEKFKMAKREELEKNLAAAKEGHRQISEHLQKSQNEKVSSNRQQLEEHLQRLAGQIAVMQYQLQTLHDLKAGDYFTEMALEGFAPLKKGDNLRAKLGRFEIVVKGDIIQEIRCLPF